MARDRWKSLDFEPPARRDGGKGRPGQARSDGREATGRHDTFPATSEQLAGREKQRVAAGAGRLPAAVAQARGAYLLRSYQAVLDLLEEPLRDDPELPGGQRILAQALARLNREPEAVERLREAVRQSSADWLARASLASLLLRLRVEPATAPSEPSLAALPGAEAIRHLREAMAEAARPALRELLGAAHWRVGQEAMVAGQYRTAARQFDAAGKEFRTVAAKSGAARQALPARLSSAYVGEAVALLAAGETDAAQRLFSRSLVSSSTSAGPLGRFAAGLYELCSEMTRLTAPERTEASAALRDVFLAVRLQIGFYDGRQAVSLNWVGGPS